MRTVFILLAFIVLSIYNSKDIDFSTYYKSYIESHGYHLEEHKVTTKDGYTLTLWHIPPVSPSNGKVAYFQHGVADSSWCFFQREEQSLPFLLSKEGFDVWLGNLRGNYFSPIDSSLGQKYDFSMEDIIKYDLPSLMNYIKSKVGQKKISYICHSQGSTLFIMWYMQNSEYVEKTFEHFFAMGTVPNIAYAKFSLVKILDMIYSFFGKIEFKDGLLLLSEAQRLTFVRFCNFAPALCRKFWEYGTTIKPSGKTDYAKFGNYLYYYPAGTSKINLLQWSQIHQEKKLVYYNPKYDEEKTAVPYDTNILKKWKIKSLVVRTDDDTFSSYEDVTEFYNIIEDKTYVTLLDVKNYGHIDILAAESAYSEVFIPAINFLKK
jgi:hypothetical protein